MSEAQDYWTEERVREELPTVKVKLIMTDKVVKGKVKGRNNRFARVVVKLGGEEKVMHYKWGTVVVALNKGTHLWG